MGIGRGAGASPGRTVGAVPAVGGQLAVSRRRCVLRPQVRRPWGRAGAPWDPGTDLGGKPTWTLAPAPPPGAQGLGAAGTEAGGLRGTNPWRPARWPRTPAPRCTAFPLVGAHGRKGARRPERRENPGRPEKGGCRAGAAGAPDRRHSCGGRPSLAALRTARRETPELLARAQRPLPEPTLRSGPGGRRPPTAARLSSPASSRDPRPVVRALPWAGDAPKGVPGGGRLLPVGSGRPCPLPATLVRGPVNLLPRGLRHIEGSPRRPWEGRTPRVGVRDRGRGTLEGEGPPPCPPAAPLGPAVLAKTAAKCTDNPDPSSLARILKDLEGNAQIANTERFLCTRHGSTFIYMNEII